jgi:hypothetical protein
MFNGIILGQNKEAVVISPVGEEIRFRLVRRSDLYFAFTARKINKSCINE